MRLPAALAITVALTGLAAGVLASGAPSHAVGSVTSVQVDANTTGNTATSIGTVDACNTIASVGQTLVIDVVVFSNVAANDPGIGGFNFNLGYNSSIVRISAINNLMLLNAGGGTLPLDLSEVPPDSTSPPSPNEFIVGFADFGANAEGGNGVLSRITLEAVSTGTSLLTLSVVAAAGPLGENLGNPSVVNGSVVVAGFCGGPTPTNPPSSTASPTTTPSPIATTPAPSTTAAATPTPTPTTVPSATAQATATSTPTAAATISPTPTATQPGQTPGPTPLPTVIGHTQTPTPSPAGTVTAGPTLTPAPSEPVTTKGDADCSSLVTTTDVVVILLGLGAGEPIPCPSAADVNCDGHITAEDLQMLLKWRGGLDVELPGGCPAIAS